MAANLQSWRRSSIRERIAFYRRANEGYIGAGRRVVRLEDGSRAFSPILPPLGSRVARRRTRLIARQMPDPSTAAAASAIDPSRRVPHVATIAVTDACQCDCRHCSAARHQEAGGRALPHGSRPDSRVDALSYDELCETIRQAVDLGTTSVVLTGGEPLLHPRIEGLVASVDPARATCTMFTNGEYLDADRARGLKQAGLYGVFVSLDHADPAAHDANRGRPGLFEKATAAIDHCRRAGLPVGISTFVTKAKLAGGEVEAILELGRRLEALEVFIFDVTPSGRLTGDFECVLDSAGVSRMQDLRLRFADRPEYPRIVHQTLFSSLAYPCVADGCPAALVQLHVRADGDVAPCDFTPVAFGNVRREPLADIWRAMTHHALYAALFPRCRLASADFHADLAGAFPGA